MGCPHVAAAAAAPLPTVAASTTQRAGPIAIVLTPQCTSSLPKGGRRVGAQAGSSGAIAASNEEWAGAACQPRRAALACPGPERARGWGVARLCPPHLPTHWLAFFRVAPGPLRPTHPPPASRLPHRAAREAEGQAVRAIRPSVPELARGGRCGALLTRKRLDAGVQGVPSGAAGGGGRWLASGTAPRHVWRGGAARPLHHRWPGATPAERDAAAAAAVQRGPGRGQRRRRAGRPRRSPIALVSAWVGARCCVGRPACARVLGRWAGRCCPLGA